MRDFGGYFTFKARMASVISLSIAPLVPTPHRWYALAVALFTGAITLACEKASERRRVAVACVGGLLAACVIVLLVSNWFWQLVLWMVIMLVLAGILHEGSGLDE